MKYNLCSFLKNIFLVSVLSVLYVTNCFSSQGIVDSSKTIKSQILGNDVHYTVYLPPDYNSSNRTYPVFYFLHGGADGIHTDPYTQGNLQAHLDNLINSGKITPMIVVTPDATRNGSFENNTYYMNDADGQYLYEDMFIKEFMPQIEKSYRVNNLPKFRAIGGLSMGGFGALYYSLQYPGLFKATVALSGAFRTKEDIISMDMNVYNRRYGKAFGLNLVGESRVNNKFYDKYDILNTTSNKLESEGYFYLDCGSKDDFLIGNTLLSMNFKKNNINYTFIARNGGHDWSYWTSGFDDMLIFVSQRLQDFRFID